MESALQPVRLRLDRSAQTWVRTGIQRCVARPRHGKWAEVDVGSVLAVEGATPPLLLLVTAATDMLDYGMAWDVYGHRLIPQGVSTALEAQAHFRALGPKYTDEKIDLMGIVVFEFKVL